MFYKITLNDKKTIENLSLSGNCFISKTKLEAADFDGKLSEVKIEDEEGETIVLNDAELVSCEKVGDEWWFILREPTADEKSLTELEMAIAEVYEMILGGD